jgi:YegS/Rv2252/BmrU family lipid kinase
MMSDADSPTRTVLIVNSGSRRGRQGAARARRLLLAAGVSLHASYGLRRPVKLPEIVRAELARGCTRFILGGGDGSISAVVPELAGRDVVLGLLPLGTANDFARTLSIPDDLEAACATIAQGNVVSVDLGLAGDHPYVNVVTMGLGAEVVKAVSHRLKRLAGPLAYPVATLRALRHYRPFAASLVFPDGDHPPAQYGRLLQLAVGNGRFYGGGAVVAPGAQIDDGMLDIYAIELHSWWALAGVAWSLKSGRHIERADVPYWRTRQVQVATLPRLPVNIDGERVDWTPESFSVARAALRVLVPSESARTSR